MGRLDVLTVSVWSVAQDNIAEERLPVPIISAAAVAQTKVKQPIRSKANGAAILIKLRLVDAKNLAPAGHIHTIGVGCVDAPLS